METVQSRRKTIVAVIIIIVLAAVAVGAYQLFKKGGWAAGSVLAPSSTAPSVQLRLKVTDADGNPLEESLTQLSTAEVATPTPAPAATGAQATAAPSSSWWWRKPTATPEPHFATASLDIKRHPVSASLYAQNGSELLSWLDDNPKPRPFLQSDAFQGIVSALLNVLKIRAEDLKFEGLKGEFLKTAAREILSADASLHYDIFEGQSGFSLVFRLDKAPLVRNLLPHAVESLTRRQYLLPVKGGLNIPVFELLLGKQKLYVFEQEGRLYAANGLDTLLNTFDAHVLDSLNDLGGSLQLRVRLEAFLKGLLPVLSGENSWPVDFAFNLTKTDSAPEVLQVGKAKMFGALSPDLAEAVLGAVPHDVFSGLALSFGIPPDMTIERWQNLVKTGSFEQSPLPKGGLALLWDLDSRNQGLTSVGIAAYIPELKPDALKWTDYVKSDYTAQCGMNSIWLAASSESLIARMKEACDRQSLSLLNWLENGTLKKEQGLQGLFIVNPGAALTELLYSGSAASSGPAATYDDSSENAKPEWKEEYDRAKSQVTSHAAEVFAQLPVLGFQGRKGTDVLVMRGFTVEGGKK